MGKLTGYRKGQSTMRTMWGLHRRLGAAGACMSAAMCLLMHGTAAADPVLFYSSGFQIIQPQNAPDNLQGQFRMDVFDTSGGFDFVFHNLDWGQDSSIAGIYFENSFDDFLAYPTTNIVHSAGDAWVAGSVSETPPLPGGENINFTRTFRALADNPPPHNGVQPGEHVILSFDLAATFTNNADFLFGLQNDALRVGMHVISIGEFSDSYYTNVPTGGDPPAPDPHPVPVPPAVGLGLVGFALIGWTNLRKRFS